MAKQTAKKKTSASKTTNVVPMKSTSAKKKPAKKAAAAKKTSVKKSAAKTAPAKTTAKKTVAKKAPAKKAVAAKKKSVAQTTPSAPKTASTASPYGLFTQGVKPTLPDLNKFMKMEALMPTQAQNFKFDKFAQEAANASRENIEAVIKSGTIFAKGMESIIKTATEMSQSAAEKQAQYAKEIMASKTINEAAEAQNKIVQENFDEFMSGATKLSEMSVKLLNDSAEPINTQVSKAIEKASKAAA